MMHDLQRDASAAFVHGVGYPAPSDDLLGSMNARHLRRPTPVA
jgi:hypothetical protein